MSPEAVDRAQARATDAAARAFEGLLLRELLEPVFSGTLEGPAGDSALSALAESLAQDGGFGLASGLLSTLSGSTSRPGDR